MDWRTWAPVYEDILHDFGFSREADEAARDDLSRLLADTPRVVEPERLRRLFEGADVTVYGPAVQALADWHYAARGDVKVATDPAVRDLAERDVVPDVIVTDLDADPWAQVRANREGALAVVHAHGDNRDALGKWVPRFEGPVMGTTQAEPVPRVHNFGGFTDGDRAVFLADHFRAASVRLVGFDFTAPVPKTGRELAVKKKKLRWAKALIMNVRVPVSLSTEGGEFAF